MPYNYGAQEPRVCAPQQENPSQWETRSPQLEKAAV